MQIRTAHSAETLMLISGSEPRTLGNRARQALPAIIVCKQNKLHSQTLSQTLQSLGCYTDANILPHEFAILASKYQPLRPAMWGLSIACKSSLGLCGRRHGGDRIAFGKQVAASLTRCSSSKTRRYRGTGADGVWTWQGNGRRG